VLVLNAVETVTCTSVIPDWVKITGEKLDDVETWTAYEVAPVEALHCSVGVVETPVAPSAGEERTGAAGGLPLPVLRFTVCGNPD